MAAQYVAIKRLSSLDTPITAEKLDGSLFTTENQAHEFIVSVRKNGVKQTVTGSVSGKFIRANGTTIFLQGSIVDGDAVVRLHQDCYNVQGRFIFNIFNTQSGVTTCIYSAVGKMDMGSTETVIDAGDVVPDLSDVVAKQEEMTQVIADARAATSAASQAATEGENKFVRFDASQTLTEAQKGTARTNIDSPSNAEITELKSTLKKRTEYLETEFGHTDKWIAGWRINATGRVTQAQNYVCTRNNQNTMYLLEGSIITINDGYTADYAFWNVPVFSSTPLDERIAFKRGNAAGKTIIIPQDCYVLLSCAYADDSSLPADIDPVAFANAAFTVQLYNKQIKDYIPRITDLNDFALKANTPIDIISDIVWPVNVANTNGSYLGSLQDDESITVSTSYYTSVYMPIKPGKQYVNRTSNTKIHFYDYSKAPISVISAGACGVFTTPVNAVYARMSSNAPLSSWQINEGDTLLDYTQWEPLKIGRSVIAEEGESSEYDHGPYDLYPACFANWYSGLQTDYSSEGFTRTSTYSEIIAAFDGLMALAPDYITKNTLGIASGLDSGGNTYTMYEYVFKPKRYNATLNAAKMPKVYLDGSIHGFEKCSTYGLYYFLKDVVDKWHENPSLGAIRQNVELHVIPVSNPYGFDRNIYKNGNDVNINRNFDHPGEWVVVPDGSDQNGLEAFDQPESAIIRDWLLAEENNIAFYANLHTNGQWNSSGYAEMNACMTSNDRNDAYFNRIFRVFVNHINEQTLKWPEMYLSIQPGANNFCGKIQASATSDATKGTASAWANTMRHIVAMTLEGFNGLVVNETQIVDLFSAKAFKINAENIGNMVIQMLREYSS